VVATQIFFIFTPNIGEDEPNLTHILQLGWFNHQLEMDVSENSGTPKSSILIGFSIINHSIWGIPIFGNIQMGFPGFHLHPDLSSGS